MVTLFVHISKKLISYVYISDWIQIPMLIDDDEIISGDGDEPRDQKWKQKEAMKWVNNKRLWTNGLHQKEIWIQTTTEESAILSGVSRIC